MGRAHTLLAVEHPLGGEWTCGECEIAPATTNACPDCYTVLCEACAARGQHTVPAGYRVGKTCSPSPQELTDETTPTGEPVAA